MNFFLSFFRSNVEVLFDRLIALSRSIEKVIDINVHIHIALATVAVSQWLRFCVLNEYMSQKPN